ncbi:MAG: NTP transferase domain-containing protein [Bacilli bacterium]|nr:NTP transferase domain-containing protein [Bacilli bacterium]
MNELEFKILLAIKKYGVKKCFSYLGDISEDIISNQISVFYDKNWIKEDVITDMGLKQLEPFKVDNAVIMAAGLSSRFVPLSLEKPKGLLNVKGEILIERQIEQLQSSGIENIIIVLGYKHEEFMYLKDKYTGIKLVYNPKYNEFNNTYTLFMAKDYLKNSYVCSSDNYFSKNPFEEYVYESFYSAIKVTEETNEWYMEPNNQGYISSISKSGTEGFIMLGHAYWNKDFSKSILKLLEEDFSQEGQYKKVLWEDVLKDNLNKLPLMKIHEYPSDVIFEFDSLDELRKFDSSYISDSHSNTLKEIADYYGVKEENITNIKPIEANEDRYSFSFEINHEKHVYSHENKEDNIIKKRI